MPCHGGKPNKSGADQGQGEVSSTTGRTHMASVVSTVIVKLQGLGRKDGKAVLNFSG
jgi:hypothetical protein